MYPSPKEELILNEAEKLMVDTMARYDPSHDKYHGMFDPVSRGTKQFIQRVSPVQRVRKAALSLAIQLSESSPDLLVVELGTRFSSILTMVSIRVILSSCSSPRCS